MKKITSIAFAVLMLASSSMALAMVDLYQGTVALVAGRLVLTRCDAAQNQYVLVAKNGKKDPLLTQLPSAIQDKNQKISVNVWAEDKEKSGENYLYVSKLSDIIVRKSCHLFDVLEESAPK